MVRSFKLGGGPSRQFEEERQEGRFYSEGLSKRHFEDDHEIHREAQLRDQVFRERGQGTVGGYGPGKEEEAFNSKREFDQRGQLDGKNQPESQ